MRAWQQTTPACPRRGRAGVVVLAALLAGAACDRVGLNDSPETLQLEQDTVQLAAGVRVVDVSVASGAQGEFDPVRATARSGDVVRFTAADSHLHALAFDSNRLSGEALAFLDRTGQLRGPPLATSGTEWIVNLAGAPPGEYPYSCISHGVRGSLTVTAGPSR